MILYIENPKDIIRNLLELISEFQKFSGNKRPVYRKLQDTDGKKKKRKDTDERNQR